ncbi:MAG: hypothetical protein IJX43_04405 [Alphaproteobacteria bacterium]|nr:hypothetical protein [Alphaproteobacteria bacterium]
MKFIRILIFSLFFAPMTSFAASSEFMLAAQLLAAAKSADIIQVQALVNNGADVNFVDSTGLSIVCTALMNNDVRAAQILQMYGADASGCDRQIKQYNNRNKSDGGGGLFSGLSSAQSISLAAAGAAVVVGGLFLLTDVFDPGNDNESGGGSGDRPDNNPDDGGGSGSVVAAFTLPYGPAMTDAAQETEMYAGALNAFSPSDKDSILYKDFQLMSNGNGNVVGDGQNYLLMMHGYSPLARGYLGMQTLRRPSTQAPLSLDGSNLGTEPVAGGRPVNVALITANGVSAADKPAGEFSAGKNSLDDKLVPWTTLNDAGTAISGASNSMVSSKYYNNAITLGTDAVSMLDDATGEDATLLENFDLADFGTVVNNASATADDNLLAKVVGGSFSGYANADYFGFMPNGQMTIFRTGDGAGFVSTTNTETGTYLQTGSVLSQIELFGKTLDVVMDGDTFTATDGTDSYSGYVGTNGWLYLDSDSDGIVNQAYTMSNGALTLVRELGTVDYLNYKALAKAVQLSVNDLPTGGRSKVSVIANSSVIEPLRSKSAALIEDILSLTSNDARRAGMSALVNQYYDLNDDDNDYPGTDAANVFGQLGASYLPLVAFSTGAYETDSVYSGRTLTATFENAVPLVYENAEHYFMSVVAVGLTGAGTEGAEDVAGFSPKGKFALTQWRDVNGTPNDASDDKYYKARACGVAGTGAGDIDPWCFAVAGVTDELAVSSAAGAVGAVKSAFSYLNSEQLFTLLALTADGPFLGTQTDGTAMTKDTLIAYLQGMYSLPTDYQSKVDFGADYLDTFAQVFGYGVINLERATTPNTSVYFYNGTNIVSANGNAYWRAATNTVFRPSSVLNLNGATISAPFFDVLESVDGEMSLPRVWENEFAFGATDRRALYMGDVLGEMKTRRDVAQRSQVGALGVSMAFSERAYVDNLNGLDNLMLDYSSGNWNFGASYQRYLTDGASRFDGMANPILGLASNAVVSDAEYRVGNWSFGARAFSGAITDEGLLENDPTISSQYVPAKLGLMQGGAMDVQWGNDVLTFTTAVGMAHESDTLLGAHTDGLLNLGAGNTIYVDAVAQYKVSDNIDLMARATFARTKSDVGGDFVLGLTDIDSNAFAIGANIGNFEFSVAQPLAITGGTLQYAHAEYDVITGADGKYELNVVDTRVMDLGLAPDVREIRFSGTYRHNFGEFTDGAIGFIYRVNPNHMDDFGNESIFMMKLTHRLGI